MLHLFPGMGADQRMYHRIEGSRELRCHSWIPALADELLPAYALRIAQHYGITATDSVGGSSFGGMVAAEIHRQLGTRQLVLIGSCLHPRAINPLLFRMAGMARVTPFALLRLMAVSKSAFAISIRMYAETDPEFLRWAVEALRKWEGVVGLRSVRHIHGEVDRIIPVERVNSERVIPEAGHLLALSHPDAVSRFIQSQR